MIETSLDRIAGTFTYTDLPDDYEFSNMFPSIIDIFEEYAPDDISFDIKLDGYSLQISIKDDWISKSLIYISKVPYQDSVRFDWNPKRFRKLQYLHDALADIFENLVAGSIEPYKCGSWNVTQVDIAFDMINEGASSSALDIVKLGSSKTALFNDRSGDMQTIYWGKRGSDTYARKYNKHDEQIQSITKKYMTMKHRILKEIINDEVMDWTDDSKRLAVIDQYFNGYQTVYDDSTIIDLSSFEKAISLELEARRAQEIVKIPMDWWRLEFVLRVKRIAKQKNYKNSKYAFERQSIDDWLNSLTITDWETISDPVLRAVVLAHQNKQIDKKTLPKYLKTQVNAIYKWDSISIYKDDNRHTKVVHTDDLTGNEIVTSTITRQSSSQLINKIKDNWELKQNELNDELNSYFA